MSQGEGGGRPTKYSQQMVVKAHKYLKGCVEEIEEFHKTRGEKSDTYERIVHPNIPTMAGLAVYLKVNQDTLKEWRKKYEKFSTVLDDILEEQERRLLEGGLSGDYNGNLAKFILSARHNYREKSDVTTDGEKLPQPLLYAVQNNDGDTEDIEA